MVGDTIHRAGCRLLITLIISNFEKDSTAINTLTQRGDFQSVPTHVFCINIFY